ncbi:hypothetical protein BCV70DRAFT_207193 [Testicularia cyperi]|uniref:Uncharacterized protein n=1 Tax=Testicularia cyperi TaxID=1882483 RepID=A0A317XNV8_9BASI|nr:hypothetical protein BCV70DRAFT_207193 [Testicularia cyperi]
MATTASPITSMSSSSSSSSLTALPMRTSSDSAYQRLNGKRLSSTNSGIPTAKATLPPTAPLRIDPAKLSARPKSANAASDQRVSAKPSSVISPPRPSRKRRPLSGIPSATPHLEARYQARRSFGQSSEFSSQKATLGGKGTADTKVHTRNQLRKGSAEALSSASQARAEIADEATQAATTTPKSQEDNCESKCDTSGSIASRSSASASLTEDNGEDDEDEQKSPMSSPGTELKSLPPLPSPSAEVSGKSAQLSALFAPIPMCISRSHQEMIENIPLPLGEAEAKGVFDSVRGLMADLRDDINSGCATLDSNKQSATPFSANTPVKTRDPQNDRQNPNDRQKPDIAPDTVSVPLAETVDVRSIEPDRPATDPPVIQVATTPANPTDSFQDPNIPENTEPAYKSKYGMLGLGNLPFPLPSTSSHPQEEEAKLPAFPSQAAELQQQQQPKSLWGLLRAPSTGRAASVESGSTSRRASASSQSSATSMLPMLSPTASTATTASSALSLFGRILKPAFQSKEDPSVSEENRRRLTRTQVDEDRVADQILSCAEAHHALRSDSSPEKLKEVGLKLEKGWRDQLAEAQTLRGRLEVTQDTLEDLEDENKHLRSQLGTLSEQIASREDAIRLLQDETDRRIERHRSDTFRQAKTLKAETQQQLARYRTLVAQERAVSLGMGLLLRHAHLQDLEQDIDLDATAAGNSIKGDDEEFEHGSLPAELRILALQQGRHNSDSWQSPSELLEELFRCPVHRFPESASPSTFVDEKVVLIGTDRVLIEALAVQLLRLGPTTVVMVIAAQALVETDADDDAPVNSRLNKASRLTFDLEQPDSLEQALAQAREICDGHLDCIVNAFGDLTPQLFLALPALLHQQIEKLVATKSIQPGSIVSVVCQPQSQEADGNNAQSNATELTVQSVKAAMFNQGLIGLASAMAVRLATDASASSVRKVRLNTVVMPPRSSIQVHQVTSAVLQLLDPCSSTHSAVCRLAPTNPNTLNSIATSAHLRLACLGPPVCPAISSSTSPRLSHGFSSSPLLAQKRLLDAEAFIALENENLILTSKLDLLQAELSALKGQSV